MGPALQKVLTVDHNQQRRGGHHHRGRRGSDRRGLDRRSQPPQGPPRDQVDVEQIMRDIRARIAQRQGVDFSTQQIQDLAARKLESILDPRAIKPSLLEALRRGAGATGAGTPAKASSEPVYTFDDTTIYDSHRGLMRFIRRLLNPILKLFFNPNPLIRALHLQGQLNAEAATREAERERRQTEWNALHYEIVQRLVTETSRLSLELQALTARVESLNGRVDFNDRRVRTIEGTAVAARGAARQSEPPPIVAGTASFDAAAASPPEVVPAGNEGTSEGARRRRRRRRGRRGSSGGSEIPGAPQHQDSGGADEIDETAGETEAAETAVPSSTPPLDAPPAESPVVAEAAPWAGSPVASPAYEQPAVPESPSAPAPPEPEGERND